MAWRMAPPSQISAVLDNSSLFNPLSSSSSPSLLSLSNSPFSYSSSQPSIASLSFKTCSKQPWILPFYKAPLSSTNQLGCRAAGYEFPDPIPEFADAVSPPPPPPLGFVGGSFSLYHVSAPFSNSISRLAFQMTESAASQETEKFRVHLMKKLSKKDIYGDSLEEVVNICTEVIEQTCGFHIVLVPLLIFCVDYDLKQKFYANDHLGSTNFDLRVWLDMDKIEYISLVSMHLSF